MCFKNNKYIWSVHMWGKRRFVPSRAKAKFKLFPLLFPPPPFFSTAAERALRNHGHGEGEEGPAAGPSSLRNTHSPT